MRKNKNSIIAKNISTLINKLNSCKPSIYLSKQNGREKILVYIEGVFKKKINYKAARIRKKNKGVFISYLGNLNL